MATDIRGTESEAYQRRKDRATQRSAEQSRAARDIGEIPAVVDPSRREACRLDLRRYCEAYHATSVPIAWSADHLKVIGKLQRAILDGGLFAVAMPRGSGKTTICELAALWAMAYGHRKYVVLIGADATSAQEMLESIRVELETNDEFAADFPEIAYPIQKLERVNQKRLIHQGRHVRVTLKIDEIVLPNIEGSPSHSARVQVAGITGRVRGMKAKTPDGRSIRPDVVIIDDPQTDESAHSVTQCASRERVISGAILGLSGPRKKIAAVMPCTVIRPGDVADNLLNPELHPEWQGERCRMLVNLPENLTWWQETYRETLEKSMRSGRGVSDATSLYLEHREHADKGAVHYWPERYEPGEASAIQSAMNIFLRDPEAFFAEFQNDPLPVIKPVENDSKPEEIAGRFVRIERGRLPVKAQHVTAMVDVQDRLLFFAVCCWSDDFTGHVVDYGTWPDQHRNYFTYQDARATIERETKIAGIEAQIYAALSILVERLLTREFHRDDGAVLSIERLLVDANYKSDTIYDYCRSTKWPTIVTPSHGVGVGSNSRPFDEYSPKPGDRIGSHWRLPNVTGRRSSRYVLHDTNHWKSFLAARLKSPLGGPGALSLFGDNAGLHRLLAEHLTAETRDRQTSQRTGRTTDVWTAKPGRDNHWLDCLVGCCVGASMQGCALAGQQSAKQSTRRRMAAPPGARGAA